MDLAQKNREIVDRFCITCLSIGKYAGIVTLECIFKYSLSKALEHHLLTF